ncbi:hypothetical protein [Arthrobacter livingstonensis]|uniref:hypothetical protein n=1 Tax=Arthrobacter livingstonensis TaxID=670078 RepID=UPI0011B48A54|nr:hypothetical protein [Arthrobacter livingstonensis]
MATYAAYPVAGTSSLTHGKLHRAAVNALSVGVALLAVAGLTVVLHAWLWLLVLLAAATSPWVINRLLQHATSRLPAVPPASETACLPDIPVEADVFVPTVRVLVEGDLCRAWRGSYQWLESTRSPALSAYIVALRQAYLDELDRRDPVGLHAWLDSCPRPRGGPEKYLHHGTDGHHLPA